MASFAQLRGVTLETIAAAQGFVRIGLIDDAVEAFLATEAEKLKELIAEEQRGVAEGLTDEKLALFDILTKPEPVLTQAEETEVKKVCKELLATLKREKLVLDWREKQQAKAGVMQTLRIELRRLPAQYTKGLRA